MLECGGKLGDSKENNKMQDPAPFPKQRGVKRPLAALFALWFLLNSCLKSPGEQVTRQGKEQPWLQMRRCSDNIRMKTAKSWWRTGASRKESARNKALTKDASAEDTAQMGSSEEGSSARRYKAWRKPTRIAMKGCKNASLALLNCQKEVIGPRVIAKLPQHILGNSDLKFNAVLCY